MTFEAWWDKTPDDKRTLRNAWNAATAQRDEGVSKLVDALKASELALNDWLNIYALEHCDPQRVAEALARVRESGTISYIARVTAQIRAALAPFLPPAVPEPKGNV